MVGPILMALALLRTFYVLSYTSIIGDVAIVSGTQLGLLAIITFILLFLWDRIRCYVCVCVYVSLHIADP